jgi:hypothetical protein
MKEKYPDYYEAMYATKPQDASNNEAGNDGDIGEALTPEREEENEDREEEYQPNKEINDYGEIRFFSTERLSLTPGYPDTDTRRRIAIEYGKINRRVGGNS